MPTQLHWTAGLHHDGSTLYVSNTHPALGERVTLRLRAPVNAPIKNVFLRTIPDGENRLDRMEQTSRDNTSTWWETTLAIHMPRNPYRFKIIADDGAYYLNAAGISRADTVDFFDFKLLGNYATPAWLTDTVFYQIFPDRFYNGNPANNVPPGAWSVQHFTTQQRPWGAPPLPWREGGNLDFYGGDLSGITQKIDYLRDLGMNALYLTPIFSAQTNHRYDIIDYEHVDQYLGGNDALIELRRTLDTAGMRLVLDVTLNHCGWFHPWFKAAQADPDAPTAEYFTFHQHPNDYESWLGTRSLPKFNYRSDKLRDTLYRDHDSVLRRWLREPYRIDGWRLDVANMQARQGAIQLGNKIGRQIRHAVKHESPQAYILGEHFYDGTLHLQGDELDATMNYQGFGIPMWRWLSGHDQGVDWRPEIADTTLMSSEALAEQWTHFRAAVPWVIAAHQFNLLDSHDTSRLLHKLHGDKALLRLALAVLMTYPGAPCIYYGTEIGMDGGPEPDNRRCMIWDEAQWDKDLRAYCQKVIGLRRSLPALIKGGFQQLYATEGLIAYQRQSSEQRLIMIGYRGPNELPEITLPIWHSGLRDGAILVDLLGSGTFTVTDGGLRLRELARGAALILEER